MNIGPFIGRVGQDAELKYTNSGKPVASFSLAMDNGKDSEGQKRDPTWLKIVLWEKKAEALAQYIKKGIMVAVSGQIGVEAWVDKNSGDARAKIVVNVREFEFCGGGSKSDDSENETPRNSGGRNQQAPARDSTEITDDDIPF